MRTTPLLAALLLALAPARAQDGARPSDLGRRGPAAARIEVAPVDRERRDVPVSAGLEGLPAGLASGPFLLCEEAGGGLSPVPCQVEAGDPPRLWWILRGATPPGRKRAFSLIAGPGAVSEPPRVKVAEEAGRLRVLVDGKPVLRYSMAADPAPPGSDPRLVRGAFIHPLWSPKGAELTASRPKDHLHHMGLWTAWTKTTFQGRPVDFWNLKEGQGTVRFRRLLGTASGPVFGGFAARHEHVALRPEGEKAALDETWEVRVFAPGGPDGGPWIVDMTVSQKCAGEEPLLLLKYHYGGIGYRAPLAWVDEAGTYLTSEGRTRPDANGTRARWCAMAGKCGEGWGGVAILGHPANLRFPEPMRVWAKGWVFLGWCPVQLGEWTFAPGKVERWRYRLLLHDGRLEPAAVERAWLEFADPPAARLITGASGEEGGRGGQGSR